MLENMPPAIHHFFHKVLVLLPWKVWLAFAAIVMGCSAVAGGIVWLWVLTNKPHTVGQVGQTFPTQVSSQSAAIQASRSAQTEIFIDISGAVAKPGLYQLTPGSRVAALIAAAGGFSKDADVQYVSQELNLALVLKDGEKVYIPTKQEQSQRRRQLNASPVVAQSTTATNPTAISLNSATQSELETLPGIGEKRAGDIIANRPYATVNELVEKGVVTQSQWAALAELVTL